MLNLAKTISYDYVRRRIHIFFFDRATAKKFQDTLVAFKGVVYKPVNMHRQDTGSVWERQLGRDGVRLAAQREYEITIYNVTRFTDIGRLSAYLQIHLAGDFELEDMDDCTPNSLTSTVWKLKIKSAECPEYLRGIVRIVWFGRTLVLKHPYAKQRLQCLKCGNLGHTMARCRYTDELLRGTGSRVAEDQEIVGLEDLAQPFSSLAEVKLSAAKRLQLQAEAESRAHEAVLPAESGHQRAQEVRAPAQGMTTAEGHEPRTVKSDHHEVAPEPKQKWIAMPLPRGRTLYAHPATLKQNGIRISSRYAELVEEDEEDNAGETKLEEKPPAHPVIDVSSGDEQSEVPGPKISAAAKAKLHLVRAKPPKLQETPQLVALKQRERNSIAETVASLSSQKGKMLPVQPTPAKELITFTDIEQALGLRQVATPSTGNCMAMALAQATADHNLAAFDENLEKITAAIKRGIHWAGQLNYSEQFDHFTRTTTLVNVNRGWEGMTPQESNKQFKWYLAEYASTPSSRKETVERHNWGCSELMSIAANFLQTKIYVLAYNTDDKHQWYCSMYRPSTVTRGRKMYETGQQVPLQLHRCVTEIRKAKQSGQKPPLVLRFWGEHYSAYVHTGPPDEKPAQPDLQEEKRAVPSADRGAETERDETQSSSQSQQGASQDPWNPVQWDGDIEELRGRLTGMSIPHDLQCEIHLILERADPTRYAELLAFLVNTVTQLSLEERAQILLMNTQDENAQDVRQMMQRYQIPIGVIQQWKQYVAADLEENEEQSSSQKEAHQADSDSSYYPSSVSSPASSQAIEVHRGWTRRSQSTQQKRQHTITPMEGEAIRQHMRTKLEQGVTADGAEPMRDAWQPEYQKEGKVTRDEWQNLWSSQSSLWPESAKAAFPVAVSSEENWVKAASMEPVQLIKAVKRFPFPEEVLTMLSGKVMEKWTAAWRRDCLHGSLVALRSRMEDKRICRWLDDWSDKFVRRPPDNLPPLVDSREDWNKLRSLEYGGDETLRLCEVENKRSLAGHIICALVYGKEISVITGQEQSQETGVLSRLARHLNALRLNENYQSAYENDSNSVEWMTIARFFSSAFQQGPTERDDHY